MRMILLVVACIGCNSDRANPADPQATGSAWHVAGAAFAARANTPDVTGNIHSVGGELGTWETPLSDCQSGDYHGFFGADFFVAGTTNLRLRYVHDEAAGDVVKIFYPPPKQDTVRVFDRTDHCAVLEGSVEKTNESTRVVGRGYIQHLRGHVKFDCTYGDGHVTGEVQFAHCH